MNKILVAYDGSEPAHRALETGIELARTFDATLGVVSVVPLHPGRAAIDPWDDRDAHTKQLAEAKAILAEHDLEAEMLEPVGEPAATIERIVEEGAYDTVIVGSRGLSAAARFLQGSVSEHIATHAHATVVITR